MYFKDAVAEHFQVEHEAAECGVGANGGAGDVLDHVGLACGVECVACGGDEVGVVALFASAPVAFGECGVVLAWG